MSNSVDITGEGGIDYWRGQTSGAVVDPSA